MSHKISKYYLFWFSVLLCSVLGCNPRSTVSDTENLGGLTPFWSVFLVILGIYGLFSLNKKNSKIKFTKVILESFNRMLSKFKELLNRNESTKPIPSTSPAKERTQAEILNMVKKVVDDQYDRIEKKARIEVEDLLKNQDEEIETIKNKIQLLSTRIDLMIEKIAEFKKSRQAINPVKSRGQKKQSGFDLSEEDSNIFFSSPPKDNSFFDKMLTQNRIHKESIFRIILSPENENTAQFELILDDETIKYALNMPDTYIFPGAEVVGEGSFKNAGDIILKTRGELIKEGAKWVIRKKSVISCK